MASIALDDKGVMKRPCVADECVRRRAAELALAEWKEWGWDEDDCDATEAELLQLLFEEVKLTEKGWLIDNAEEIGEFFAELSPHPVMQKQHVYDALEELVKQWAACLRIELPIAVGTVVTCDGEGLVRGVVEECRVVTAEYLVKTINRADGPVLVYAAEKVALNRVDVDG